MQMVCRACGLRVYEKYDTFFHDLTIEGQFEGRMTFPRLLATIAREVVPENEFIRIHAVGQPKDVPKRAYSKKIDPILGIIGKSSGA